MARTDVFNFSQPSLVISVISSVTNATKCSPVKNYYRNSRGSGWLLHKARWKKRWVNVLAFSYYKYKLLFFFLSFLFHIRLFRPSPTPIFFSFPFLYIILYRYHGTVNKKFEWNWRDKQYLFLGWMYKDCFQYITLDRYEYRSMFRLLSIYL